MRPSLRLLGAELIPMARRAEFPMIAKPRAPPKVRVGERVYPIRKQYLFDRYRYMLSSSRMVLAFQHNNLDSADLQRVRDAIASIKLPEGVEEPARVTVLNGGLFGAVCGSKPEWESFRSILVGGTLAVYSPTLHPKYISLILATLDKATAFKPASPLPVPSPFSTLAELRAPTSPSPLYAGVNPKIFCVGGIVDGEILSVQGIRTVSAMQALKEQQAMVVGLTGASAQSIAGVVSAAAGGQLSRVLEGLRVSLEPKAPEGEDAAALKAD